MSLSHSATAGLTLFLVGVGCDRVAHARDPGAVALAERVPGVWDAAFRVERTPLGPAPRGTPPARGVVALVPSRAGVGRDWLGARPTHDGVYELDFRPLGFVPEAAGPVPVLVAAVVMPDSLVVATPPGVSGGTLVVRATLTPGANSARGTWAYRTHAVGGWGGTVTLYRRPATPR
jgi:hypothetical protein